MHKTRYLGIAAVALTFAMTGCSAKVNPPKSAAAGAPSLSAPSVDGPSVDAPSTGTSTDPSPAGGKSPATGASKLAGACTVTQLRITLGFIQGAAGHSGGPVIFRNAGTSTCHLSGYPGVAALNSKGAEIEQAKRTASGSMGGITGSPTTVTLAPGQSASAMIESTNAAADGQSCGTVPELLVTPPNETHSIKLFWHGGCAGFQVHPVVAGDTGQGPR